MEYVIGVGAALLLIIIIVCIGYVKSPPDTAYIISGFRKPRILIGKAGIRIPFLERLDKLRYTDSIRFGFAVPDATGTSESTGCRPFGGKHQTIWQSHHDRLLGYILYL